MACGPREGLTPVPEKLGRSQGGPGPEEKGATVLAHATGTPEL